MKFTVMFRNLNEGTTFVKSFEARTLDLLLLTAEDYRITDCLCPDGVEMEYVLNESGKLVWEHPSLRAQAKVGP